MADAEALLGTWKMVAWERKNVASGEITDAMGPNPIGHIAYHADGRMMAVVIRRDRLKVNGRALSVAEKAELFDSMLAYSAAYTLEGDTVIHHVDAAWNPAWQIDLIRPFTLAGDTLEISNAPGRDPITGEEVIYRIEFRRMR